MVHFVASGACQLRNGLAAWVRACHSEVPKINPSFNLYCVFFSAGGRRRYTALARSDAEPPGEPGPGMARI